MEDNELDGIIERQRERVRTAEMVFVRELARLEDLERKSVVHTDELFSNLFRYVKFLDNIQAGDIITTISINRKYHLSEKQIQMLRLYAEETTGATVTMMDEH